MVQLIAQINRINKDIEGVKAIIKKFPAVQHDEARAAVVFGAGLTRLRLVGPMPELPTEPNGGRICKMDISCVRML
jgi:hypothetical protein